MTGFTSSLDYPTTRASRQTNNGLGFDHAFVTKLNNIGTALMYSTYLGGSERRRCLWHCRRRDGGPYVTGYTYSTDFPTKNPVPSADEPGTANAFVTKLSGDGSELYIPPTWAGVASMSGGSHRNEIGPARRT